MRGGSERNGEAPPGNLTNPIDKKDLNMTANQPRQPARAASLHGLVIDRTERPVIDELAALRLQNPCDADYAGFVKNPPSIAAIAVRARHHAEEAARFVALVQNTNEATFRSHVGQLFSVVILNNIANIAIALLPAHTGVDRHAKREQGYAVLGTLDDPHDNPLRSIGQIAFGLRRIDAVQVAHDAIAFAAASGRAPEEPGRATVHSLEEQATLNTWLARGIDTDALMEEARHHVRAATRFARSLRDDDLGPAEYEATNAAQEGAILQHLIAFARIALAPQVHDARARLQSACDQMTARPQARATLELAMAMGDHLRSMMTSDRS